jgi:O-antigen ligase
VDNRALKIVAALGGLLGTALILYVALTRPGYFTNNANITGILLLELLAVAVWLYRRIFFAIVMTVFLLAGVDLPVGSIWTMARWGVLALGALVGLIIVFKERRFSFGIFEILALLALLAAVMSAAVSRFTSFSFLKVLSLVLLFLYSATGARVAVLGRESRFFTGLLTGCQIFVAMIGGCYLLGIEAMGNPNSLGAVMGVVAAPILLWGTLLEQSTFARRTQMLSFAFAMYLTYISHARASIVAVLLACSLLCLCLRRYMLLGQGVLIVAILIAGAAIFQPEAFSNSVSAFRADVVYKGKNASEGLLGSRTTPWQETMNTIRDHYWFGTGFGTSDTGQDPTESLGKFASSSLTSKEHGSSYLEILEWVGVLGSLPFFLMIGLLLVRIFGSMAWMFRTANPSHPVVPLAVVLLAALLHAAFEDWLFAPGYYLCLFFWGSAFIFMDEVKLLPKSDRQLTVRTPSVALAPEVQNFAQSR